MIFRFIILALVLWAAHASAALLNTGSVLLGADGTHLFDVGSPTSLCRWDIDSWNTTTCTWGS